MSPYLDLDNTESLRAKVDKKARELFEATPREPQLQVSRLTREGNTGEKEITSFLKNQDITDGPGIGALRHESNDLSQIFIIRQNHSWTTLNISRRLFEDFLGAYGVFSKIWKFVFPLGIKWEENEFEFPGFASRHILPSKSEPGEAYELAYILRRVESRNRKPVEGQRPWSIRQTAVYHKFNLNSASSKPSSTQGPKSTFLLIAPSQTSESQLNEFFELSVSDENAITPWNVHRLLVVDSLRGWMDYMAWIEVQLMEESSCVVLAKVGAEKEKLSPLTDFNVNFKNRQTLKILEDYIVDLQVILSTMQSTVMGIRDLCKKCCAGHHNKDKEMCGCDYTIEEFDEHVKEIETCIRRAEALRERARSTAQLLADLLSYEDAIALKELAERSTKDAAAVKVLTVISLVYLPTTIVANFFSTQFVHTGDNGGMKVSTQAWLLAVIAIPLTALTIAMWWAWVRYINASIPDVPPSLLDTQRKKGFCCLRRKKQAPSDPESGGAFPPSTIYPPKILQPLGNSGTKTWSSTATTVKSG